MSQLHLNQPASISVAKHQSPISQNTMSPMSQMSPPSQAIRRKFQSKELDKMYCRKCPRRPKQPAIHSNQKKSTQQPVANVPAVPCPKPTGQRNNKRTFNHQTIDHVPAVPSNRAPTFSKKLPRPKTTSKKIITNVPCPRCPNLLTQTSTKPPSQSRFLSKQPTL